ncbi:MAG: leucine-rich repeat domain-containing protein, partial [archaeon]|nr:leucine-rich repeat domain-containing protein [archaeon]
PRRALAGLRDSFPMHAAAGEGHSDCVLFLMRSGAPVDLEDAMGYTALHVAAEAWHLDIAELLFRNGASLSCRTRDGCSVLHLLARNLWRPLDDLGGMCLMALVDAAISAAPHLSDAANADGNTPLHEAAETGSDATVRFIEAMCRCRADVALRNRKGLTALDAAVSKHRSDRICNLLKGLPKEGGGEGNEGGGERGVVSTSSSADVDDGNALEISAELRAALDVSTGACDFGGKALRDFPFAELRALGTLKVPIKVLKLEHNQFAAIQEHRFFMVSKGAQLDKTLATLSLAHNALTSLPRTLSTLKQLTQLNLAHNQLDGLSDVIGSCQQLRHLNVAHNKLRRLPATLGDLRLLTELLVEGNPIENVPPALLQQQDGGGHAEGILGHLRSQKHSSRRLSALHMTAVGGVDFRAEQLAAFPYEECMSIIRLDPQCAGFTALHLGHNLIQAIDEGEFFAVFGRSQLRTMLKHLDMSHNRLAEVPRAFSYFKCLEHLNLSHNNLTSVPSTLATLESLGHLDLSYNCLTKLPAELSGLSKIHTFDLSHNPNLLYPPPEIVHKGGRAVVEALGLVDSRVVVRRGSRVIHLSEVAPPTIVEGFDSAGPLMRQACFNFVGNRPGAAFKMVLSHLHLRELFMEFLRGEYSDESLRFLDDVELFRRQQATPLVISHANSLFAQYFSDESPDCLNVSAPTRLALQDALSDALDSSSVDLAMFDTASCEIQHMLENDSFRRFIQTYIIENDIKDAV